MRIDGLFQSLLTCLRRYGIRVWPDGTILYTPFPDYEVEDPLTGANTVRTTYRFAGQIVAMQTRTGTAEGEYFYTYSDHLGNVAALSSKAGAFTTDSLARYDPFGNYRTTPSTVVNPALTNHGFTGHRHNNTGLYPTQNVGLIYMNARYYLPEIGRFISPDTMVPDPSDPQSFNRYSYVLNNPLNFTDPSGYCALDSEGNITKTDCTVEDFQALSWEQRLDWLKAFVKLYELGDWFVDIERVIQVFAGDPDYNDMGGWAAYADAAVLQAINDGMLLASKQQAIGSNGEDGGAAWAAFFRAVSPVLQRQYGMGPSTEDNLIMLRLAGEQGGVDYATNLPETERRYNALSDRVHFKSWLFLTGANSYRSFGIICRVSCSWLLPGPNGILVESLVVAHTDPRTSGDTALIQFLAQRPDRISSFFFPNSP